MQPCSDNGRLAMRARKASHDGADPGRMTMARNIASGTVLRRATIQQAWPSRHLLAGPRHRLRNSPLHSARRLLTVFRWQAFGADSRRQPETRTLQKIPRARAMAPSCGAPSNRTIASGATWLNRPGEASSFRRGIHQIDPRTGMTHAACRRHRQNGTSTGRHTRITGPTGSIQKISRDHE